MPDTPTTDSGQYHAPLCTDCKREGAYVDGHGALISGGYGSTRHDTDCLIWLIDREKKFEALCDDCVDRHIAAGNLEHIGSGMSELPEGPPSERAYHKLFAYGALTILDAFQEETGEQQVQGRKLDQEAIDKIRRLRNRSTMEDNARVVRIGAKPDRSTLVKRAIHVGEVHAFAAIALGHAFSDPDFKQAAAAWTAERMKADRHIALVNDPKRWSSAEKAAEAELSILFEEPEPKD